MSTKGPYKESKIDLPVCERESARKKERERGRERELHVTHITSLIYILLLKHLTEHMVRHMYISGCAEILHSQEA